jgi:hypothetical protein
MEQRGNVLFLERSEQPAGRRGPLGPRFDSAVHPREATYGGWRRLRGLLAIALAAGVLLLAGAVALAGPPGPQDHPPPPGTVPPGGAPDLAAAKAAAGGFAAQDDLSASEAVLAGDEIDVAITGDSELDPAVALCASDQYLAVYTRDGEVYGQRLTSAGDLLGGAFIIYDRGVGGPAAYQPDVACEWIQNRFVVVWSVDYYNDGTDFDVYAQGVKGAHQTSGSQLYGARLDVSEDASGIDERDPAIACNSYDATCLVVFEYSGSGAGDIYGQRVSVGSTYIYLDGDRFVIGGYPSGEYSPAVAWGSYDDDYLVAWQYWYDSSHYRILFALIYDTEQHPSDDAAETYKGSYYLINPADGWSQHQTVPAVAYNGRHEEYLVAFQYDYYGDGSDIDIGGHRIDGSGAWGVGAPFFVTGSGYSELAPAVAFSGGPENFPGGMGSDQYLVAYVIEQGSNGVALFGQAVWGAHQDSGSQRDGVPLEIDRAPPLIGYYIFDPDVTGSINNGRYMSVWQYQSGGIYSDDDVLGRMLEPSGYVYLPFILRNN